MRKMRIGAADFRIARHPGAAASDSDRVLLPPLWGIWAPMLSLLAVPHKCAVGYIQSAPAEFPRRVRSNPGDLLDFLHEHNRVDVRRESECWILA